MYYHAEFGRSTSYGVGTSRGYHQNCGVLRPRPLRQGCLTP